MKDSEAADVLSLRRHNLSLVLHHLRDHGQSSRIEVSGDTGLGAGAVTSLVGELIGYGLAEEVGLRGTGSAGRPRRLLTLGHNSVAAVGVRLDPTFISVRVTDLAERERYQEQAPHGLTAPTVDEAAKALAERVTLAVGDWHARTVSVVVAVPGWTDRGIVTSVPFGWRLAPLLAALHEHLPGIGPVALVNDGNLETWAEYQSLRLTGVRDLIYLAGGLGAGGGVVVDGRLVYGAHGAAGELGHLEVEPGGLPCPCGRRGCLERYVSLQALLERTGIGEHERGVEEIAERAERGDPATLRALREAAERIHSVVMNARMLLNPQVVVLGGHFGRLVKWLGPVIAQDTLRVSPPFEVRAAGHGRDAALHGATCFAAAAILDDPLLVTRPT
ncbi:ROK family protein [Nonomuraea glycinis]|uniref:ROK family protein n=1 Tax=Nonomuraea glycinis TaxID=2047744 RepID=UPI002E0FAF7A|nr:ROK family protein [Nonomuraea glycinis]